MGGIVNCHCQSCRKAHAAAYTATAKVKHEHFRWLSGQQLLSAYESSPGKTRSFCSACGSHLVAERMGQEHVILRVATLDDKPLATVACHIWCSQDVSWLNETQATPHYAEWPPQR